ncbi:uncharacterized protein MELLADRAFT_106043 [Melampsora larici-populina 98AG31]|uniref:Uncharacterized protein n=1 Tax=Melampsora larici-populina (strain 98AG31 / pathotype 3-4-7) TaxID=747676 RepID=F4RK65_MELLP|nr:uncharacterized protein MELLADRAFT_106043 [Melampsora larici-populina 98AG31]EGG07043.1 hypothetical protein MELLADRAFT_106043 [Melampsora larici-populina 98AG31]
MSRSLRSQDSDLKIYLLVSAHGNYSPPPHTNFHPSACVSVQSTWYSVHSFRYQSQASHPLKPKDSAGNYHLFQAPLQYFPLYVLYVTGETFREGQFFEMTVFGNQDIDQIILFFDLPLLDPTRDKIEISVANKKMQKICSIKVPAIATVGPTSQIMSSCPDSVELHHPEIIVIGDKRAKLTACSPP